MCRKLLYFVLVLVFCLASSMPAANIVWVSDHYDELADQIQDDIAWVEMLEANGYTVDNTPGAAFGNGYWRTLDADKIAALNAADLVIISRNSNSGDFASDATETEQWNSITTPLILLSPYFSRSSRWLWVDNTGLAGDGGTPKIEAVDPAHPIFYGMQLDTKNQVEIYDQLVGTGTVSFYNSVDVGNGTLIGTVADQDWTSIAEWKAGVEFHDGSGQIAAGRRMLLCIGTREGVGYGRGEYNLNAEGEKLFLNAIEYMLGSLQRLKAFSPLPEDGTLYLDAWATLTWSAGDTAVSHDIYFGDIFTDVNEGSGDTFRGNQTDAYFIVGFPGFPYPDGLTPGTTYYWRIDQVEADEVTTHKGDVWSFTVPPRKAYFPDPPDGARFVETNAGLSWSPGRDAKVHTVYFGDNFDDVNDAADGMPQTSATYDPGPLEEAKMYYWRVDEFDGITTHRGDVWSFRTASPGGGVRGMYYRSGDLSGVAAINRIDPEINFDWADGSPDPSLQADSFSVRWTGELEVEFSETYTFYANTDDGVRLWINNELVIDRWVDRRAPTEAKGTIDLVGGQRYPFVMEYYESGGDAVAQLSWENSSTEKQIIPQVALSLPVRASGPSPRDGATGTRTVPTLTWNSGDNAVSHEVYFGTDADAVANATQASPEYKGTKALGDESYDTGKLAWDTSYYWRIDEVNNASPDSPWIGNVWTFTTGDFLVVDDFETYDIGNNEIWWSWKDGLGYGPHHNEPAFAGNGTGSAVGDETTSSYTEETIVHGGRQSMPIFYDNNKQGSSKYSEAELTLTASRDWTEEGVAKLSIWFRGNPASVGSFVEGPVGTYTMTAGGADIWNEADEFHFAYKMLTGVGTIQAQVLSVDNTDPWAKAGVMIRETLDPGSKFAAVYITPGNGCRYQARTDTGIAATSDTSVATAEQMAITAPYWIQIERDFAGNFRCYYSADGTNWQSMSWNPQNISMSSDVYIGLAVTSHNVGETCEVKFSNVTITGTVDGQWSNQDVGIASNSAEPMYVAVSNSTGTPAVVVHDDPAATTIDTWTEWVIPLQAFADQGIVLTDVDRIAIGLGTRGNMTIPGGSGKMYIDDIRLYQHAQGMEP
jgi:hypothetical protein